MWFLFRKSLTRTIFANKRRNDVIILPNPRKNGMGKNPRMAHMNILLINLSNNIPPRRTRKSGKVCLSSQIWWIELCLNASEGNRWKWLRNFLELCPWDVLFITNKIIMRQRRVCLRHIRAYRVFRFLTRGVEGTSPRHQRHKKRKVA